MVVTNLAIAYIDGLYIIFVYLLGKLTNRNM